MINRVVNSDFIINESNQTTYNKYYGLNQYMNTNKSNGIKAIIRTSNANFCTQTESVKMRRFRPISPNNILSPKSRRALKKQIIDLKNREYDTDDKKLVDDRIIRYYLIKNNMTVGELRAVVYQIEQNWRQVTALILFRSVVIKAKRITDVMLNKHQSSQMIEYKHCFKQYQRVCKELISVYTEKEYLIKKLNSETTHKVEIETTNFDTELNAINIEYKNKLNY